MILLMLMFIVIMMAVIMMMPMTPSMIRKSVGHDGVYDDCNHDINDNHDAMIIDRTNRIMIMTSVIVIIKSNQRDFATRTLTRL